MAPFLSKHIYHSIKNVVPAFKNEEQYFDLHTQRSNLNNGLKTLMLLM